MQPAAAPQLQAPAFLDVPALLESSQPRPRVGWFWYGAGIFLLIVMGATFLSGQSETGKRLVDALSALLMLALISGMMVLTVLTVRRHRGEQQEVEAASELVQLRRWPQAAVLLQEILSKPARGPAM